MSTPRTPLAARVLRAAVALAACTLVTGCVRMPTSGPVVEPQVSADADATPGISFDPRPPQAGDSAADIVGGFLEAMKARPSPTVARQFLSQQAADDWRPEDQILTYSELGSTSGETAVRVPLTDVSVYDARGAWQSTVAESELTLGVVEEDGEWRIDELPDALIVPDSWFADWYQRVSIYYFDPTAELLVPQPVFVPRGDQFASSLVRGLLTPATDDEPDVVRTFFPPGTEPGLSVPIEAGIAQVALSGDPDAIDADTAQRMLAQLVWTLRQDERINAVQLTVGGRAFGSPTGSTQVRLDVGSAYDPSGARASTDLYALDRGLVVSGDLGSFAPTSGPLGQPGYAVRSIGVDVPGATVAAVSRTGRDLFLAPLDVPEGEVTTPLAGGVDLAEPQWDSRGRVWVLDRGAGDATVYTVVDGAAQAVDVPGLSGRAVRQLLVSRDGTRLVAVVRGTVADRVVSVRVRQDAAGAVVGFTSLRVLPRQAEGSLRVRDVAWRSPTTVSVLSDITDVLSQVRTVSADGAPGEISTGGTTVLRGANRLLVSSPVDAAEVYAVAGRAVSSLTRPERSLADLPAGLRSVTYAG